VGSYGAGRETRPSESVADIDSINPSISRHKEAVPPPGRRQQTPSHTFTGTGEYEGAREPQVTRPGHRTQERSPPQPQPRHPPFTLTHIITPPTRHARLAHDEFQRAR